MVYFVNPIGTSFSDSPVGDIAKTSLDLQDNTQRLFESFYELYPTIKAGTCI